MPLCSSIKAVCFDAFGTLVEITDKRRPFVTLLQALSREDRQILRHKIMRERLSLKDCLDAFENDLSSTLVRRLQTDLEAELNAIKLRPHAQALWTSLRNQGYKIGLCSNLAADYCAQLLETLPGTADALVLSCDTGYIKPEPEIYQICCDRLGLSPENIIFTGDTQLADVDGPKAFGMSAELIGAFESRVLGKEV